MQILAAKHLCPKKLYSEIMSISKFLIVYTVTDITLPQEYSLFLVKMSHQLQ